MIIYFTLYGGSCGLHEARSLESGIKQLIKAYGTANVISAVKATPEQISCVKAMGGWCPEEKIPIIKPKKETIRVSDHAGVDFYITFSQLKELVDWSRKHYGDYKMGLVDCHDEDEGCQRGD